jgi:DNA polymerase III sliding clamp (beta) subunit (PCNA family)
MLNTLKFVSGAISKKNLVPYMSHFCIQNGTIRSYNGMISLCSPIPIDLDCHPKADLMVKAIANCDSTIALSITNAGRLKVQSGKFKAFIECLSEVTPDIQPEGEFTTIDGKLLIEALTNLYKFIGDDASRPWSSGVLLSNGSAYATNNVCIIEHWLGFAPKVPINIPKQAIREILRIGETPETIQMAERSITLHYSDGRWIKSQLLETCWPDIGKILNVECNPSAINNEIFDGLEVLKPFVDNLGSIHISPGLLATSTDLDTSANYEVKDLNFDGIFNIEMLNLLKGTVTTIDWGISPCLFFGDRLRGAIIGMRR